MEQLPQTNPITTSLANPTPYSPKDLEMPSDFPDSEVFLDQEDDSSEEVRSREGIRKKPSDISKKKYHYIPDDIRLKLIDEVENKGEKIKHAAKKLNINYSSAKSICQIYRKEGRSNKKISKRKGLKEEFTKLMQEMKQSGTLNEAPVAYPQVTVEENTQTEPAASDTLTALRDRLLQSRARSRFESSNLGEIPLENDGMSTGLEIRKDFSDGLSAGGNGVEYQPDQKPVSFVNNGAPAKYMTTYMPAAQTVYYLIPYQNMPQMQTFQQMPQQSFSMGGPSQTININQPQASTISTQSISIMNTQNTNEAGNFGGFSSYGFSNNNLSNGMIQQMPQYQQIPIPNQNQQQQTGFVSYQPQGVQMMRQQPMVYVLPQQGVVQGMQNNNQMMYQQMPRVQQMQGNINYGMAYNPNMNQKLNIPIQFSGGIGQESQMFNENGKQDLIEMQNSENQYKSNAATINQN